MTSINAREDIDRTSSDRSGLGGLLESSLRSYRNAVPVAILSTFYLLGACILAVAAAPGVWATLWLWQWAAGYGEAARVFAIAGGVGLGYFAYGFSLLIWIPLFNRILPTKLKPGRQIYHSLATVRWFLHNGLTYLVRYTFLEFITPTPFNLAFYRMMGMSIGRGVQLNTSCISDPSLITIGDKATVGGSVTIAAHYGSGGFLILAPVVIGARATIGLRAIVMGDTVIGERAKILPNSVVMPKTRIPDGEIWGGIPARALDPKTLAPLEK